MEEKTNSKTDFLKDDDWKAIDGEPCRVLDFTPLSGSVKDGKVSSTDSTTPYALIHFECKKLSGIKTGSICHKLDFLHLWKAFKEKGEKEDEEVIIFWSKEHLKNYAKLLSGFMPRLWVMVCHKEALEIMTDQNYKSELGGEARAKAMMPISEWKPEVLE